MSHENVELVKRGYEASNQTGKLSPEVFAADFVLDLTETRRISESFGGSKPRSKLCAVTWRPSTSSGSRSRR